MTTLVGQLAPPASHGKGRARLMLVLFLLSAAFFVGVTRSPLKSGFADAPNRGAGDVALYRAEIDRIHAGESYYDAAAAELRARGYPTRSVFNWRTPLPVALIGVLPDIAMAKAILGLLCLTLAWLSFGLLVDEGSLSQGLLGMLLLSGALLPCVLGDLVVMSELWSGVLIAISIVCFAIQRRKAGVLAGVGALFFRELAAPYCLLCLLLAARNRRYREAALWCLGLAAYLLFFAWHAGQVLPRIAADDVAHASGWIRFGGAGFLISTAQLNTYLLLLPQWVSAIYLACALLACAGSKLPGGQLLGLTVAGYAVAFSVAGHDFNQYWGSMIAPMLCLAACQFPHISRQLWAAAGWSTATPADLTPAHN